MQTKCLCLVTHLCYETSLSPPVRVIFLVLRFLIFLFIRCSLVVTCWERAKLLALLYVMFYCVSLCFVTFPSGVLGQVWCLILSMPDLCHISYFEPLKTGSLSTRPIQ